MQVLELNESSGTMGTNDGDTTSSSASTATTVRTAVKKSGNRDAAANGAMASTPKTPGDRENVNVRVN